MLVIVKFREENRISRDLMFILLYSVRQNRSR